MVAGISGGIDSAVTACLLKEIGCDITGIHIQIDKINKDTTAKLQRIEDLTGINISIVDASERFQKTVINYFRDELLAGRSPSPCAFCNPSFKWKILQEKMFENHADGIASGHYIQKVQNNGKWYLKKGIDEKKDQSYFLWGLDQDIIKKLITPLGIREKKQTRYLAKHFGLDFLIDTNESTGLCFSNGLGYQDLIDKYIPEAKEIGSGPIKDNTGKTIGSHKGYIYYTIGQKKELNLNQKDNLCVTEIITPENTLIVSNPEALWKKSFTIEQTHFIDWEHISQSNKLQVKVRGFGWNPEGYAQIIPLPNNQYRIDLENPAWAPALGQPAVFYSNNLLVGGGIIQ